jgi:hypothetical protein
VSAATDEAAGVEGLGGDDGDITGNTAVGNEAGNTWSSMGVSVGTTGAGCRQQRTALPDPWVATWAAQWAWTSPRWWWTETQYDDVGGSAERMRLRSRV